MATTSSRSRLIRRIIYVLVGLVIIAFIVSRFIGGPTGPQYTTVKVQSGEVAQTVQLTGTTEPKTRYSLQFPKSGRIAQILVQTGSKVKAGDVLAVLENTDVNDQLQSQKATLQLAEANLAKALAGEMPQQLNVAKLQINLAQSDLDNANTAKQDYIDEAQQIADNASLAQQAAQTALNQAQEQYNYQYQNIQMSTWDHPAYPVYDSGYYYGDMRSSYAQTLGNQATGASGSMGTSSGMGMPSDSGTTIVGGYPLSTTPSAVPTTPTTGGYLSNVNTIDSAQFDIQKAQDAYNQATDAYNKAEADVKSQQDQLDSTINKADIGVKSAQEQYNLAAAKPRDVDVAPLKAQIDQAWQGVNLAQYELDQTILKAPTDGTVGNVASNPGELTNLAQALITMDTTAMDIKALVSEADIAKIQVGQNVQLTFDAFGTDQQFQGMVYEVDPSETIVQGVVYYTVKMQFDPKGTNVKPGMTANLVIQTSDKQNVLEVPSRAVQYNGNQAYVQVLTTTADNKQQVENRNVQIGLQGDDNIEILSGLQAGDNVVTFTSIKSS